MNLNNGLVNTGLTVYSHYMNLTAKSTWGFSDDVLPNAALIELSISYGGKVVSEPVEQGSFISYNKTVEPMEIQAVLGFRGTDSFLQSVLDSIKTLRDSVTVFNIETPTYEYENVTLQNYSYTLRREDGLGVLYIDATFIEVREVEVKYAQGSKITANNTLNASAVSTENTGLKESRYSTGESVAYQGSKLIEVFEIKQGGFKNG